MKKLLMVLPIFFLAASCNKKDSGIPERQSGALTKDTELQDQKAATPQTRIEIGRFKYMTDNSGLQMELTDSYDGTALRSGLKNLKIVVSSNSTDSSVLADNSVQGGSWQGIPAKRKTLYRISVYVDAPTVVFGTIIPSIQVQQGNNVSAVEAGQTTTFGYKVSPSISVASVVNTQTTNGTEVSLTNLTVQASGGSIAMKQFAYRVLFADNGRNDTLHVDSLQFFKENVNITDLVTITDSLGNKVTTLSELTASHKKIYVTFTSGAGESVVQRGFSESFDLRATVQGFGPAADGDAISITPITDAAAPASNAGYVVKGSSTDVRARLGTSPFANSGATLYNLVWSDLSATPHSAIYGVASNDWKSGYGITFNVTSTIYHSRTSK